MRAEVGAFLVIASALATVAGIIALRPLMARYALARPNARSSHSVPTPQGGGIAIVLSVIVATLVTVALAPGIVPWGTIGLVLTGTVALAVIGAVDDIVVLRPLPRLVCQVAAAIGLVVALHDQPRIVESLPGSIEVVLITLAVVWFVNLVNFMDGIDLITVVEIVPIAAGVIALTVLDEAPLIAGVVACALLGGMIGFTPFNRPVAKLFLGDVGSLPIGLLVAWLLLLLATRGHLVAAVLLPLYYLADATITLARRTLKRERIWDAHRTHYYQRATARGLSVTQVDLRILSVNLFLTGCAIASVRMTSAAQLVPLGLGVVAVAALLYSLTRGKA